MARRGRRPPAASPAPSSRCAASRRTCGADPDRGLRARLARVPALHVLDASRAAAAALRGCRAPRERQGARRDRRRGARNLRGPPVESEDHRTALHAAAPRHPLARRRRTRHPRRRTRRGCRCSHGRSRYSNVSFSAYLTWVRLSSQNGLLLSMLRQNMEWAAFFLLPMLVSYHGARPGDCPRRRVVARARRGARRRHRRRRCCGVEAGRGGLPSAAVRHLAWATARALAGSARPRSG